jgi:[acyl-carrier-protein] S-malonyltransferase
VSGLAILCSGQGRQQASMFDELAADERARPIIDRAAPLLGGDPFGLARDAIRAFRNREAQLLICTRALAAWAALSPRLPAPVVFAGYSVGELAAYGCAGALTPPATLSLAEQRAAAMDACARTDSGLVAVRGLRRAQIDRLCRDSGAAVAIINGPDHYVLGGAATSIERAAAAASAAGAQTVRRLPVAIASHTSLLADASAAFSDALAHVAWSTPCAPVLAGIDATPIRSADTARAALAAQLSTTIDWAACIDAAREHGADVFLELGPGDALARMVREQLPDVAVRSLDEFHSVAGAVAWVERALA